MNPILVEAIEETKEVMKTEMFPNYRGVKAFPLFNQTSQNTWYRKVMQRSQRSRHTRTKRGRK